MIRSLLYAYVFCLSFLSTARKTQSLDSGNSFYQLKPQKESGNPAFKRRKTQCDDNTPLPRRDILPGEKMKTPRSNDSEKDSKKKIKLLTSQETRLPLLHHGQRRPNRPLRPFHLTNPLTNYSKEYFSQYLDTRDDAIH